MKAKVSTFSIAVGFFRAGMPVVVVPSYSVSCFTHIPGKLVFVSFTGVQSIICANNRVQYGLKSYSFVYTLHYLITITIQTYMKEHITVCQVYSVECVSKIKSILFIIFYAVYGLCVFSLPIPLWWMWEYMLPTDMWIIRHRLGSGHEAMICAGCLAMFLTRCDECITLKRKCFWWNFRRWLHRKLSKRQLSMQPKTKITSTWHFCSAISFGMGIVFEVM